MEYMMENSKIDIKSQLDFKDSNIRRLMNLRLNPKNYIIPSQSLHLFRRCRERKINISEVMAIVEAGLMRNPKLHADALTTDNLPISFRRGKLIVGVDLRRNNRISQIGMDEINNAAEQVIVYIQTAYYESNDPLLVNKEAIRV
jgi:hypothetical protein